MTTAPRGAGAAPVLRSAARAAAIVAATAALVATACSELPPIEAGVCGNRVVESGEDCDGAGTDPGSACGTAGDNACFFVCGPPGVGPTCPDGFQCGTDQRCRSASGLFKPLVNPTRRFDVEDFRIGDVDGDGIGDAIGGNARAIRVRFGSVEEPLASELDVSTRSPTGPVEFTNFGGSSTLDAVVPVGVGIFSLLSNGPQLSPVAYSSIPLGTSGRVLIAAAEVVRDVDSEIVTVDRDSIGFLGAPASLRRALPETGELAGTRLPVADLDRPRGTTSGGPDACPSHSGVDAADEIAIAFAESNKVYIYSGSGCDIDFVQANTLTVGAPRETQLIDVGAKIAHGGAHFGQFDADECLDLLISITVPCAAGRCDALALAAGQRGGSNLCAGEVNSKARTIFVANNGQSPALPFVPLAAGRFDDDLIDDLVIENFVRRTSCGACGPAATYTFDFLARAATPWTDALVTDLNHDGKADIAAISESVDDVEVLLGAGAGAFNRYKVDTSGPVRQIRTADFDGDLFLDLAIVEAGAGPNDGDVVSISFGSSAGGPSPPVFMGELGEVQSLAAVSSVPDVESIDSVADLIVVSDRTSQAGRSRSAAILLGDTSRRMVAPFVLRTAGDPVPDVPRAVVAGQLDAASGFDVAVVSSPGAQLDSTDSDRARNPRLWLLRGGEGSAVVDTRVIELGTAFELRGFEPLDALYAVGELDGEMPSELIGIDRLAGRAGNALLPSRLLSLRALATLETRVDELPALGGVRKVRLADLDGDGLDDLYATFGAASRDSRGAMPRAVVVWNRDTRLDAGAPLELTVAERQCTDLAPLQVDRDEPLELALLCAGQVEGRVSYAVYVADLEAGARTYGTPRRVFEVGEGADALEVGDIDGDRIDDLVIRVLERTIVIVHQCSEAERLDCLDTIGGSP